VNRKTAEKRGRTGESLASWYLRLKGYHILARRVRTARGEIDVVARRRRNLVFVEVKARQHLADLDTAIDHHRLARVAAAAEILAPRFGRPDDDIRIDVILLAPWHWPRQIENAWMG
jgi:putative endonuclease